MFIKGRFSAPAARRGRWTALVCILASVAALGVAPAVPAAAKVAVPADTSLDFQIYLANASTYGPYEAALGYIDVKAAVVSMFWSIFRTAATRHLLIRPAQSAVPSSAGGGGGRATTSAPHRGFILPSRQPGEVAGG